MDDFGLLARDFGFRPQVKSAPMSSTKPSTFGSGSGSASTRSVDPLAFDDVFGGPPKYLTQTNPPPSFDSIFDDFKDPNPKSSSMPPPVYDKPVYDDDIFDGVPGIKSTAKVEYEDVFASISKGGGGGGGHAVEEPGAYDDLLGSLGGSSSSLGESKRSEDLGGFEELIPGFGGSSPPSTREPPQSSQHKSVGSTAKSSPTMPEDPFVVLETNSGSAYPSTGMFTDPLEQLGRSMDSGNTNVDASPVSGGAFDDIDAFEGLAKSTSFSSKKNGNQKDKSPLKSDPGRTQERSSVESFENIVPKTQSTRSFESKSKVQSPKSYDNPYERNATADQSPKYSDHVETADDIWLTVSEIPLFTQPTSAPPPSRPPPPLVIKQASVGREDLRSKVNESYSQSSQSYSYSKGPVTRPSASPIDELEEFAMGNQQNIDPAELFPNGEDIELNSAAEASAAAMKEAMDKAEAKFKHAKEVRERERDARSARSREFAQEERDDSYDLEDKEKQEKLDLEQLQREREEREREQVRLQVEREKARQAVERATREARERAAAEARIRAERVAVGKVNAEARQRAERAAVQRVAAEARERAAAEARERAERVAAEARERAAAEARERAAAAEAREKAARERVAEARATAEARERSAVERATAEARVRAERAAVDRAHAEARERAAAAAREKQQKTEDDMDSLFGMGARANSAPKQRATTTEHTFDSQAQSRGSADAARRTSSTSSTIRKASSTTNIVDDLSSIFGGTPSAGDFQEVDGETEERRRARLERHQRTRERAAKALAEKNERDMQAQRDQAERHRISETLDVEIKRWAAGKEGNLRALLSTLQYVLWPQCGWQPVSLTDLITGAAVKKVYRKATLCIHPDKVQQKGANLQQKYIAEKVFDLLKEAWNKFNSEELF